MRVAGLAHDLNNLLSGIVGEADLASMSVHDDAAVVDSLRRIRERAACASDLIRQLAADLHGQSAEMEAVDMVRLLQEAAHVAPVSRFAVIRVLPGREPLFVPGKHALLQQLLLNLIVNAVEAIGERPGEIVVSATRVVTTRARGSVPGLPAGDWVCVEVSDTGCGISEEWRQRIFDPYFSTKSRGRGIGLAVVKAAVRAHGGVVQVRSEPGRGSTFQVFLPRVTGHSAEPGTGSSQPVRVLRAGGA